MSLLRQPLVALAGSATFVFTSVLASSAVAAPSGAPAPGRHPIAVATPPADVAAPTPSPDSLDLVIGCDACDRAAQPTVSFLWVEGGTADGSAGDAAAGHDVLRAVRTTDWKLGHFQLIGAGMSEPVDLQGESIEPAADGTMGAGWRVAVPLLGRPLPFRTLVSLSGYVSDEPPSLAHDEALKPAAFNLRPIEQVLGQHPQWDPARTAECDLMLPKEGTGPRTLRVGGTPAAWIFPTPGTKDGSWTFQFVRPGGSLLQRLETQVQPLDQGDSWAFKLPLAAILPHAVAAKGQTASPQDVQVTLGDAPLGQFLLGECPRAVEASTTPGNQ